MIEFKRNSARASLAELPPLTQTPGYTVLRGDPRASVMLAHGEANSRTRLGTWRCTEGAFRCTEKGDELQTITQGRLRIEREDGSSTVFEPGDSFFTRKGEVRVWDVI